MLYEEEENVTESMVESSEAYTQEELQANMDYLIKMVGGEFHLKAIAGMQSVSLSKKERGGFIMKYGETGVFTMGGTPFNEMEIYINMLDLVTLELRKVEENGAVSNSHEHVGCYIGDLALMIEKSL